MIIYFETIEIRLKDIPRALQKLGYSIKTVDLQIKAQGFHREKCDEITLLLQREKAEYAISYDFSETISRACLEVDIPYIAWVYDNPQQELYTGYAHYPNNYIFVFDKLQQKRLMQTGIRNVYHMPLAIDSDKVKKSLSEKNDYAGRYAADIAFVGQLYRIESLEEIISRSNVNIQVTMEKAMADCFLNWEKGERMHGRMPENCVEYFDEVDEHKTRWKYPFVSERFYYEAAVLSRLIANRERMAVLNHLAEQYDVRFYTFDTGIKGLSPKVKVCPGAKYDTEVSHVYAQSKINLNITLHCIETGISQRVFDVMAAGGFLLTNYQEELEELFVPGEDLVIYHNLEELQSLTAYYLEHEEERKQIARNGQKKVLKLHDFSDRMKRVMELVDKIEQERGKTYADILDEREDEIEMMQELSLCANLERKLGTAKVIGDIADIDDAKEIYFDVRKVLLNIINEEKWKEETWPDEKQPEQAQLDDRYDELCGLICKKKISSFYIVWQIYTKSDKMKESILLKLCESMKAHNLINSIELISYGLLLSPHATNLLLKKAECLMDIAMWPEALAALKEIRNPKEDVLMLIQELENALGI